MPFGREVRNKLPQTRWKKDYDAFSVNDRAYSCQGKAEVKC